MTILHLFNSSVVSGPETLVIPALGKFHHRVEVVFLTETRKDNAARSPVDFSRDFGLKTSAIDVRSRWDGKAIRELAALISSLKPSILHAHDVKASTYAWLATKKLPAKARPTLVSTHHGVRGRKGPRARLYESFYCRLILPHFDRVLAVCDSDAKLIQKRGVRADKIRVHRNGVDRRRVDAGQKISLRQQIHEAWAIPSTTDLILGFVGRLAPEKRIDRLLQTIAYLNNFADIPPYRVFIFGTGPLKDQLVSLCHKLGLDNRIVWMGYRQGLGDEMAGLDLLLSFSDAEGLPINLIEAGWAATPVFSTGVDGILDLVPTPAHGTLFSPTTDEPTIAARLARLLRDHGRRQSTGIRLQERVTEHFSGRHWLRELNQIYLEIAPPEHELISKTNLNLSHKPVI